MKSHLRYIGVVDKNKKAHVVPLYPGVNVITGKSSTGKSALIEIFDFCFGSNDFTIPEGVITESADIYFVVLEINDDNLVLARRQDESRAFLKTEPKEALKSISFSAYDFNLKYFIPLSDYKKEIGKFFGLNFTSIDQDDAAVISKGRRSPTPSIRSFASYLLQHQNLIANKHAVFYRFDEKEKREQAIEHFKIFAGFADQNYFLKYQELNELQTELKNVRRQQRFADATKDESTPKLIAIHNEYMAVAGKSLVDSFDESLNTPQILLDKIKGAHVEVSYTDDEYLNTKRSLEKEKAELISALRQEQAKLNAIQSSIEHGKSFSNKANLQPKPQIEGGGAGSPCPFCLNSHSGLDINAEELEDAINWLNSELQKSSYMLESFLEEEQKTKSMIMEIRSQIKLKDTQLTHIDEQVAELGEIKTQYEQSLKIKLQLEIALEDVVNNTSKPYDQEIQSLKDGIKDIEEDLKKYNVETKIRAAENSISEYMNHIGERLDFEDSYKPINLRFSLETFDLWHQIKNRKVFLRSMGSGANWLYCHIVLFLAMHKYFASLKRKCSIPSILFFDQPSQVYFPSEIDLAEKFEPSNLASASGKMDRVDEDIAAVTNLYSQIVEFCKDVEANTGINPQIILTDHADHLNLATDATFESLIRARWRKRGFIEV